MNAIIRPLLCAVALCCPLSFAVADPPAATTGKVLVIDYDRLMEGNIERLGDRYRIRQGGGEMTVPASPNMLLLPDRETAFELLKGRLKPDDLMARVRLARWCLENHFATHATEMAEAALAMHPDDRSLKAFVDDVKLRASLAPPPPIAVKPAAPKPALPEGGAIDLNPESFGVFVNKVQPILMNACVQCHSSDRSGAFRLVRTATSFGDTRATQFNLAAASAFVNPDRPSASPLLTHAVSVHGDCAAPPLKDRKNVAYRHLEEWVGLATGKPLTPPAPPSTMPGEAVANATPLTPEPASDKPASPKANNSDANAPVDLPAIVGVTRGPLTPATANNPAPAPIASNSAKTGPIPSSPPAVLPTMPKETPPAANETPAVEPKDPFDPVIFNRMNQPKKP
jgi:hypothetical protein